MSFVGRAAGSYRSQLHLSISRGGRRANDFPTRRHHLAATTLTTRIRKRHPIERKIQNNNTGSAGGTTQAGESLKQCSIVIRSGLSSLFCPNSPTFSPLVNDEKVPPEQHSSSQLSRVTATTAKASTTAAGQECVARNRAVLAFYMKNEAQSVFGSRKGSQLIRHLSSDSRNNLDDSLSKNNTEESGERRVDEKSIKDDSFNVSVGRTEEDFADYLTGKISPKKERKKVEVGSATSPDWVDLDFSPQKFGKLEQTAIPDNHDAEVYRTIRKKQERNLETSRSQTAKNVQRALAGNIFICAAKLGAWISSGSSSMLSEFVHSVVDCGNQALLLVGLRETRNEADKKHPYGYGKSIYFWALVSALGTFFLGSGLSMTHAVGEVMHPSLQNITWEVWTVLGVSFAVDGYVLGKTISDIRETMPKNANFLSHVGKIRDPAVLAVLLEDGAACLGVLMAMSGIAATSMTGQPIWDGVAGVMISGLLGAMGIVLVKINHRFLLGQAVDKEITEGIEKILLSRRSIDNVYSVQSQWTGPATFSYKAEVDFDGTFLAAKLMPRYQKEFLSPEVRDHLDQELRVLLSWYAEDVMRTVEREVRNIEAEIRTQYPGAEFIELEPMSKEMDRFAVDDGWEAQLRRIESERLNRYLHSLYPKKKISDKHRTKDDTNREEPTKDSKWTKKK